METEMSMVEEELDFDAEEDEEPVEKLDFTVDAIRVELARQLSFHHARAMKLNATVHKPANSNEPLVEYLRGHAIGYAEGFEEAMEIITAALLRSRES